jgi:beta-alanine degradation protein BauB
MKASTVLCVSALVLCWGAAASAQDPVKVAGSQYKVLLENAGVRVLKVDVPTGGKSPMHQHPDTMVIPLTDAKVRFTTDGKSEDVDMAKETAIYMPVHTHSGANIGKGTVEAVLIEFKTKAPGTAAIPASRPGITTKTLAESPRGVAYRSTADAKFQEPAGSKHEFDQIVIGLGPAQMSLSIDGKPAKTTWARGDVQFIGRGVPHESRNTGGKPVDLIIVAIK